MINMHNSRCVDKFTICQCKIIPIKGGKCVYVQKFVPVINTGPISVSCLGTERCQAKKLCSSSVNLCIES